MYKSVFTMFLQNILSSYVVYFCFLNIVLKYYHNIFKFVFFPASGITKAVIKV